MNADSYDYFICAYEAPSFAAAASKVPMSPQGLAKAIKTLERDLGVPLFEQDESGRRKPTEYAAALYDFAKRVQSGRNALHLQFEKIASRQRVSIRLVASLGVLGVLGADFIRRFERSHPHICVTVTEVPDATCDQLLQDGLFDLALTIAPFEGGFKSIGLYRTAVEIWMRDDHPLARRNLLEAHDLAGARLAAPGNLFKCHSAIESLCAQAGCEAPSFVDLSEIFWIYDYVQNGRGLGFTLPHLSRLPVFESDPRIRAVTLHGLPWEFGISRMQGHALSRAEGEFVKYLREHTPRSRAGMGATTA